MENKNKIDEILNIIAEKLENVDYAFTGSVNLYIQGLKIKPRDIDILTTADGVKTIDKILERYRIKEIYFDESEGRNSFRSFYQINGAEIEVLGNVNNIYRKPESLDEKIYRQFNKVKLPCISLTYELDTYKQMGRAEKVEVIQELLRIKK